jgi:hypothetical protein
MDYIAVARDMFDILNMLWCLYKNNIVINKWIVPKYKNKQ